MMKNDKMKNIITMEEFSKFLEERQLERYKEMSQKFQQHLDTVPEEYREAVVADYLEQLVKLGWINKEFADTIIYNKDYNKNK